MRRLASTGSSANSSCSPVAVPVARDRASSVERNVEALALALFNMALRRMAPGCEISREPPAPHWAFVSSDSRLATAGDEGSVREPLLPAVWRHVAEEGREIVGEELGDAMRLEGRAAKRVPATRT